MDVLILSFNSVERMRALTAALAHIPGVRLHLHLDGPRPGAPDDVANIDAVRCLAERQLGKRLVNVNQMSANLGTGVGLFHAVSDFLSTHGAGVILEDDCIPAPQFFSFCEWALGAFAEEPSVAAVSGCSFLPPSPRLELRPYLSRYPVTWGWAGWDRTFDSYSLKGPLETAALSGSSIWNGLSWLEKRDWRRRFSEVNAGAWTHIWDFQLVFSTWMLGRLTVAPPVNLITNIGFGPDSAHFVQGAPNYLVPMADPEIRDDFISSLQVVPADGLRRRRDLDDLTSRRVYCPTLSQRLVRRLAPALGMKAHVPT